MEEGWRGNLNEVDVFRCRELLEGLRAVEEQLLIDWLPVEARVELVEVTPAQGQLVGEEVGQRNYLGRGALGGGAGDGAAAFAATAEYGT